MEGEFKYRKKFSRTLQKKVSDGNYGSTDSLGALTISVGYDSPEEIKSIIDDLKKAVELDETVKTAQDTLREVSLEFAAHLRRVKGFESARPFYERAIVRNPQRAKEKKTTVPSCYAIATSLIELGELEEAKKYHFLGWKSLLEGDSYYARYKVLASEFESQKTKGKLYYVVRGKGFGFLELLDQPGQSVFLHKSHVFPNISMIDFDRMEGRTFSFIVEPGAKLPEARTARLVREKL